MGPSCEITLFIDDSLRLVQLIQGAINGKIDELPGDDFGKPYEGSNVKKADRWIAFGRFEDLEGLLAEGFFLNG